MQTSPVRAVTCAFRELLAYLLSPLQRWPGDSPLPSVLQGLKSGLCGCGGGEVCVCVGVDLEAQGGQKWNGLVGA